jgi:integrase
MWRFAIEILVDIALEYEDVREDYVVLYTRKSRSSKRVPRLLPRPIYIEPGGKGRVFTEWTAYPRFLEVVVRQLKQPRWNWHGLRHRRASIWANQGMPLIQLMAYPGHRQIQTTQRYLHSLGIVRF